MSSSRARWYTVQVYSGAETRVSESITERADKKGMRDKIEEIYIPTETIIELKNGEKVNKVVNYFPGYIFIKMFMDDDLCYLVRNIPKVSGFVGMNGKPTPVSDAEMQRIVEKTKEVSSNPRSTVSFEIGDQVKVLEGPFASFTGQVEEVEKGRQRLKVAVTIFGRATPVALDFGQVERI